MIMQMQGSQEENLVRLNRNFALQLKEKHPNEMKSMSFDDKFAMNRKAGKEVPFNLPHDQFKEVLISMFGGRYERY